MKRLMILNFKKFFLLSISLSIYAAEIDTNLLTLKSYLESLQSKIKAKPGKTIGETLTQFIKNNFKGKRLVPFQKFVEYQRLVEENRSALGEDFNHFVALGARYALNNFESNFAKLDPRKMVDELTRYFASEEGESNFGDVIDAYDALYNSYVTHYDRDIPDDVTDLKRFKVNYVNLLTTQLKTILDQFIEVANPENGETELVYIGKPGRAQESFSQEEYGLFQSTVGKLEDLKGEKDPLVEHYRKVNVEISQQVGKDPIKNPQKFKDLSKDAWTIRSKFREYQGNPARFTAEDSLLTIRAILDWIHASKGTGFAERSQGFIDRVASELAHEIIAQIPQFDVLLTGVMAYMRNPSALNKELAETLATIYKRYRDHEGREGREVNRRITFEMTDMCAKFGCSLH